MAKHDSYSFDITLRIEVRPEGCRWASSILKERIGRTVRVRNKPQKINRELRNYHASPPHAHTADILGEVFVELGRIMDDRLNQEDA